MVHEDDGVGFPDEFDVSNSGHMGLRFIHTLSKSIAKTYQWDSDSLGIRFEISGVDKLVEAAYSTRPPHERGAPSTAASTFL